MTNNLPLKKSVSLIFLLAISFCVLGQKTITGIVKDSETDLPGVSISIKGTSTGTITDQDGGFSINVNEGDTVSFSFIGYETEEVIFDGIQTEYLITLNIIFTELDELIVVGYGAQRKKDLTGAVGVVDVDEMKKQQSPNIGQALQGQVPGVSVTTSGQPGKGADIRIRGIGSFSDVGPLYVIDGMIMSGLQRDYNDYDQNLKDPLKNSSCQSVFTSVSPWFGSPGHTLPAFSYDILFNRRNSILFIISSLLEIC